MKKFHFKKEKVQEEAPVAFPLNRRHTLMDLGQEPSTPTGVEEPPEPRKCASRARSIDSLEHSKVSPDPSLTFSSASTVVITESELASSWIYKNIKATIAAPEKVEDKLSEMTPTSASSDQPTILDDPKMIPVAIPTKPRQEKFSSRCCYFTVLIIITLCTLGILSIIGSVIYLELFAAYKTMTDTPIVEKPLMKGIAVPRQSDTDSEILKKSSDIQVFGNRPFGEKPDNDGRSIPESSTDDTQNKSSIQTFLDDISSRITSTLKSQGIIDQSSTQLTEDLNELTDKLLLSAEETWNASQNLMADIASLFRPKSVSNLDESTSPASQVEEDLRELSELPRKMLDGFIRRPLGPFPSFNFIPFGLRSDKVDRTGLVAETSSTRSSNKEFETSSHFPTTPQLEIPRAISEATPVQDSYGANPTKTEFQSDANTPSLSEGNEVALEERITKDIDLIEVTPNLPTEKIYSELAGLLENSSKLVEIESVEQINQTDPDEQLIGTFNEPKLLPISPTPSALVNMDSDTEYQSDVFESTTNIIPNTQELSSAEMKDPVPIASATPEGLKKSFQTELNTDTTHQLDTSSKIPIDIKSSLAEAMKHLLALDVNKNIPSSRSKPSRATKTKAIQREKMIGPVTKPLPEVNNTTPATEAKSERMRYLQKLRSIMFGKS